jgi:hypothetical protein
MWPDPVPLNQTGPLTPQATRNGSHKCESSVSYHGLKFFRFSSPLAPKRVCNMEGLRQNSQLHPQSYILILMTFRNEKATFSSGASFPGLIHAVMRPCPFRSGGKGIVSYLSHKRDTNSLYLQAVITRYPRIRNSFKPGGEKHPRTFLPCHPHAAS